MRLTRLLPAALASLGATFAPTAGAQSLLERPPNLSGNWTGSPGTLYFHFLHRFGASGEPERKVSNVPTFLVGAGLPRRLLVGVNYSTNSTLAPRFPNEWELLGRWAPLAQELGAPLDLGAQVAYNNAAAGFDAELSAARRLGVTRVLVAGRALSDPLERGNRRFAVAGGAAIRLGTYVSLTGDAASLLDRDQSERVAWSAGLHLALPLTPHTLSLQATNSLVTTLQGASRGAQDVRYGFEFTIPLTLRRYFGRKAQPPAVVAAADSPPDSPAPADTAPAAPAADTARPPAAQPAAPATAGTPATAAPRPEAPAGAPARTAPAPSASARPAPARPPAARPPARVVRSGMKNVAYLRPRIEVTVGTTVEWTNSDPMPHTVTAANGGFDSGLIAPNKTYRRTFTRAGTYEYYCMPHPFMKGVVVVKAAP